MRKLARFSGGLVLILCMLRPLGTAEPWELALDLDYPSKLDRSVSHIHRLIATGREHAHAFFEDRSLEKVSVRALVEPAPALARSA